MAHYLLRYTVAADYLARRGDYRSVHLVHARAAIARGELLLGGAIEDLSQGALLLFSGDTPAAAERFAATDPYVLNGLVTSWRVDRWITVVGEAAAEPVAP
jgi:uncharacterized protein YciI